MTERSLKIRTQKEIVKPNPNRLKMELAQSQDRDPYYTHGKIERCEKRIRESKEIRPRNKQLFLTFVKWLRSDATAVKSESRVLKYYRHFWLILRLYQKDMEEMTREDVEELLNKIRGERICGGKSYSPATYADFLRLIKIFWKWMKTGGESPPSEVKWIRVTRITHNAILNLLKNAAARAGIRKRIHPHIFRHYRVKELLLGKPENGIAPLHPETVRRMMGWRSMKMLERYGQFMNSDLRDIYIRFSGKKQLVVRPAEPPTRPCPICTFKNPSNASRCLKCARALNLNAALQDEQRKKRELAQTVFQILRQYGVQINDKELTML